MNNEESAKNILDRYVEQYVEDFFAKNISSLQILPMIKVTDFNAEVCRNDFAGIPKQPVVDTNNMVSGIGKLLPKLVTYSSQEQRAENGNRQQVFVEARKTLRELGMLLKFRNQADGEQYGVTQCKVISNDVIEIRKMVTDEEAIEHADRNALLDGEHDDRKDVLNRIDTLMKNAVQSSRFGGYIEPKQELAAYTDIGRQYLEFYISEYAEAEAFADSSMIGPLTFSQWKRIAINVCALGFAKSLLEDIDLLKRGRFTLEAFSLMPPSRISSEELRECFYVSEIPNCQNIFDQITSCLILSEENAEADYGGHGVQPILIRIGDEVLMPRYSRLGNPYMFLVTRLAQVYRGEIRRIVSEREKKFQDDLSERLDSEYYLYGNPNVFLYRPNKTILTDIDSVIYEKETNCLYLIQLKWFALYDSFEQRESQYEKLQDKGNEWIDKVQRWVDTTPPIEVLKHVGFENIDIDPKTLQIRLVMLNRGWTRFSGKEVFENTAAWISWSRLCWMLRGAPLRGSKLAEAWDQAMQTQTIPFQPAGNRYEYKFPGLTVIVFD